MGTGALNDNQYGALKGPSCYPGQGTAEASLGGGERVGADDRTAGSGQDGEGVREGVGVHADDELVLL